MKCEWPIDNYYTEFFDSLFVYGSASTKFPTGVYSQAKDIIDQGILIDEEKLTWIIEGKTSKDTIIKKVDELRIELFDFLQEN